MITSRPPWIGPCAATPLRWACAWQRPRSFWDARGYLTEGRERSVARAGAHWRCDAPGVAHASTGERWLAGFSAGDYDAEQAFFEEHGDRGRNEETARDRPITVLLGGLADDRGENDAAWAFTAGA